MKLLIADQRTKRIDQTLTAVHRGCPVKLMACDAQPKITGFNIKLFPVNNRVAATLRLLQHPVAPNMSKTLWGRVFVLVNESAVLVVIPDKVPEHRLRLVGNQPECSER